MTMNTDKDFNIFSECEEEGPPPYRPLFRAGPVPELEVNEIIDTDEQDS